jgi:hypothetical protein
MQVNGQRKLIKLAFFCENVHMLRTGVAAGF